MQREATKPPPGKESNKNPLYLSQKQSDREVVMREESPLYLKPDLTLQHRRLDCSLHLIHPSARALLPQEDGGGWGGGVDVALWLSGLSGQLLSRCMCKY